MGRKKALGADAEKLKQESKYWCFFCDRPFEDFNVLLQHQRSKHFRCLECDVGAIRGKCESVQGLIVHTLKVHGKGLTRVPNALQGRDRPELNVYGMDGIPDEVYREKGLPVPGTAAKEDAGREVADERPNPSIISDMKPGLRGLHHPPDMPPLPHAATEGAPGVQEFLDFLGKAAPLPSGSVAPAPAEGLPGVQAPAPALLGPGAGSPPSALAPPGLAASTPAALTPGVSAWQGFGGGAMLPPPGPCFPALAMPLGFPPLMPPGVAGLSLPPVGLAAVPPAAPLTTAGKRPRDESDQDVSGERKRATLPQY